MSSSKDRFEIVMAGSGGQGLIVSGVMLAEAAMLEGKNVVQTQSYGIASRGGFSQAEVIIADGEIIFQQVERPDTALALTEEAMDRYAPLAASGVPVFYDTSLLAHRTGENLYGFPFTEMAGRLGHAGTANMIALGAMSAVTGMVSLESLARVVGHKFSGNTAEMNIRALHAGAALPEETSASADPTGSFQETPEASEPGAATADGRACPTTSADRGEFEVTVDFSLCKQCGYCKEVCKKGVFEPSASFNSSGYRPMTATGSENCVGCLQCLMVCPDFAVSIEPRDVPIPLPDPKQVEDHRKENAS